MKPLNRAFRVVVALRIPVSLLVIGQGPQMVLTQPETDLSNTMLFYF